MKAKTSLLIAASALLTSACCCDKSQVGAEANFDGQEFMTQAIYWYQSCAETVALYHQGFNIATERVAAYQPAKGAKTPAVVLDIDETVLDNSPFEAQMVIDNIPYTKELFASWTEKGIAEALPGAVEFVNFAIEKGFEVFFITNRYEDERRATMANMESRGFPRLPDDNYLFRQSESDKTPRRSVVLEDHEIVLLLGDNLTDFDGIFQDRATDGCHRAVDSMRAEFGRRFIVFPNPMYGDWDKVLRPADGQSKGAVMRQHMRGFMPASK